MEPDRLRWIEHAIELAVGNVHSGRGGPFGAVVVRSGAVVATGVNLVTSSNDPTAHAEVVAIRAACEALGTFQLEGCEIYSSCEPCPMCLGAIYWARPSAFYFACSRAEAAGAGFDDAFMYEEFGLAPEQRRIPGFCLPAEDRELPFTEWERLQGKIRY
jgi:guanine deaminase